MYYSPVQRIFQIVSFKLNHESASKTKLTTKKLFEILSANLTVTSGEAVTQSFLEVLMALWNSLLSDTSFREEVLLSEELFGKRSPIMLIFSEHLDACNSSVLALATEEVFHALFT